MKKSEFKVDEKSVSVLIGKLSDNLSHDFFTLVEEELALISELLKGIEPLLSSKEKNHNEGILTFLNVNTRLAEFLSQSFPQSDQSEIKNIYREYTRELEVLIAALPKKIRLVQEEKRFNAEKGDLMHIRFLKWTKRFARSVHGFSRKFMDMFRKDKHGLPVWKHNVPVRQIFRYSFRNVFLSELFPLFRSTMGRINKIHYGILEMMDVLSHWFFIDSLESDSGLHAVEIHSQFKKLIKEAESEIKLAKSSLEEEVKKSGDRAMENYYQLEKISGTIEFSDRKSSVRVINRKYSDLNKHLSSLLHSYDNTTYYIFDDWRFDTAINGFSTTLLKEKLKVLKLMREQFQVDINSFTAGYAELLKETESFVSSRGSSIAALNRIRKEFKTGFASLLIKSLSALKGHAIPVRIRSISRTLLTELNTFPETKVYAKKFNPTSGLSDKDIVPIRPADILRPELIPEIEGALTNLVSETQKEIDLLLNHLTEIGTVAEFSIDSAIKQIKEKHEGDKNPVETLVDGLARSEERIKTILGVYEELERLIEKELAAIVKEQIIDIQALRGNEKLVLLNMRLARALLKKRGKERFRLIVRRIERGVQVVLVGPLKIVRLSYHQLKNSYKRFVTIAAPEAISGKLSAFLAESKNAVARLPYVYQRLYLVEPLSDDLYYYSRDKEVEQLDTEITYWENKQYSPIAILCEKGSGATSFINQYRKGLKKYPSFQIGTAEQIYSKEKFLAFLSKNLKLDAVDFDAIVAELNSSEERIIFLEDLQNLYLRTVDGFNALKTLFTLISLTNEKILWVTSCTQYAWEYLELSLNISGYFNAQIQLTQLDDVAIRDLILKRHSISGYSITYFPNIIQEKSRQYRKLPHKEKQAYLEERYFYNMNKFAKGNVSLALHFWLRSTMEVQDKRIIISSLYDSDYSFLNTLNTEHLVILTMICLHDGINAEHISLITRKSVEESQRALNMLFDDSVIVKRAAIYLINPLLYRQVIEFLKNKNFIQ